MKKSNPPSSREQTVRDTFFRGPRGLGPTAGSFLARHSLGILVGSGLLMMVVLSQLSENGIVSWFNMVGREQQLREEVATLEKRNQELEARLEALRTDPEALEKIAREEQNMRRPEEEVLMVLAPEKGDR